MCLCWVKYAQSHVTYGLYTWRDTRHCLLLEDGINRRCRPAETQFGCIDRDSKQMCACIVYMYTHTQSEDYSFQRRPYWQWAVHSAFQCTRAILDALESEHTSWPKNDIFNWLKKKVLWKLLRKFNYPTWIRFFLSIILCTPSMNVRFFVYSFIYWLRFAYTLGWC